jgi:hypothetical protein
LYRKTTFFGGGVFQGLAGKGWGASTPFRLTGVMNGNEGTKMVEKLLDNSGLVKHFVTEL